ncbi:uncharacterized protein [Vicugna pacos]|uniref:Uncharacterized protein n=1 Tax=Vicugna pacos TaxID=30538 RepID=A0ABM5CXK7_VICPA
MVFQDISLPSRSTETCYSMPQHLVSQLTGLSCTEENEFGLNNTSTYLASWTLGLRAALPHTGAYDNCLPSAPPVHVSPSTFPRLPSSSPILPPSAPLLSQDPERIAGPPAHAQLLPAGPRVGSSSSEPGIGPNGFSALSPCRPLATAWGRGLWLWKCKLLLVESGKGSGSAEGASVSLIRISAPAVQEFLIDPVLRNSFRVGKTSASQNPQFQRLLSSLQFNPGRCDGGQHADGQLLGDSQEPC